jgi:hypothetical protein
MREVQTCSLKAGVSKSCGCSSDNKPPSNLRHGHCRKDKFTPEYTSWQGMHSRCRSRNPNSRHYKEYVARGIRVCKRWKKFENFLADMGPKPGGMRLGRRDVENSYTPSNTLWMIPPQKKKSR